MCVCACACGHVCVVTVSDASAVDLPLIGSLLAWLQQYFKI